MSLRRVILAVAALMALPSFALAQTSRVEGMALPGDYIKDYTGIYTYTSCVTGVGNLVYAELGNISGFGTPAFDRSVGAVLQNLFDGKFGTWAVHLREMTPQLGQGDNLSSPNLGNGSDPNTNTNESFDVMWGHKFGTTSLGLRLNRSYYQLKTEPIAGAETIFQFDNSVAPANANFGRNITGFGGGLTFEMSANTKVDVGLLYQSRTFENNNGTTKIDEDSPTTYLLAGRVMYQWQPNVMVVPVIKYYSFNLSQKTTGPPAASFDNSLKGWQAGAAGNWTVGNNDLFVLGLAFASNRVEEKQALFANIIDPNTGTAMVNGKATETLAPEVFAALETHTNNWLTLRFGARKSAYRSVKIEPTAGGNSKETSSPFTMNIGAGVKLSTLQLDAILDNAFPQLMGWLGSGVARVYFPKVTATYAF